MTQAVLETRIRQVFVETFEQSGVVGLNTYLPGRMRHCFKSTLLA